MISHRHKIERAEKHWRRADQLLCPVFELPITMNPCSFNHLKLVKPITSLHDISVVYRGISLYQLYPLDQLTIVLAPSCVCTNPHLCQ